MSQTETNPLNNPTVRVANPNQLMDVLPPSQLTDHRLDGQDFLRMHENPLRMLQMDWLKLPQKNKYFASFDWTTTSTGVVNTQQINHSFVQNLIPVGSTFNTFFNYDNLFISVKNANNPFYAGLLLQTWDNAPSSTYYVDILGFNSLTAVEQWQFSHQFISPKTDGETNCMIPINYPFAYFKNVSTPTSSPSELALDTYISSYTFGFLRHFVLSPLKTTSTILNQNLTLSGQLLDLSTAGLNF